MRLFRLKATAMGPYCSTILQTLRSIVSKEWLNSVPDRCENGHFLVALIKLLALILHTIAS